MIDYLIMKGNVLAVFFITILIVAAAFLYWFKAKPDNVAQPLCLDCNVVLVSFDTLRADHVGVFGYKKNTTPTIDKFAQEGFVFTNAVSVTSWTLPSHMSWFTGVYPSQHKVLNKFTVKEVGQEEITNLEKVSPGMLTLAEILKQNGYKTGGFTGGAGGNHEFGFDKGFDIYTDDKEFAGFSDSIPKALDWISQHKGEKVFVFLHGYDIHGQYEPEGGYDYRFLDLEYNGKLTGSKEEQKDMREEGLTRGEIFLTEEDVRFLTALYDEKIQRADEQFSRFIAEYKSLGLMDKTIIIFISDHGEELYEHGRIDHGHSLYEEQIRVPLIITVPATAQPQKIDFQVRSIDIMPTIFGLVGINPGDAIVKQMAGVSLVPFMKGEEMLLDVFPETDYRYATFLRAVGAENQWKLIRNLEFNSEEVYNLKNDPEEKDNMSTGRHKQIELLKQKLDAHLDSLTADQ